MHESRVRYLDPWRGHPFAVTAKIAVYTPLREMRLIHSLFILLCFLFLSPTWFTLSFHALLSHPPPPPPFPWSWWWHRKEKHKNKKKCLFGRKIVFLVIRILFLLLTLQFMMRLSFCTGMMWFPPAQIPTSSSMVSLFQTHIRYVFQNQDCNFYCFLCLMIILHVVITMVNLLIW